MRQSSGKFEVSAVGLSRVEDVPYGVGASAGARHDGMVVPLALGAFSVVGALALRVTESCEGGLEDDLLRRVASSEQSAKACVEPLKQGSTA